MVIRRMNNMFSRHGRWLFAIITLFIIIAFVGFLTPGFASIFFKGRGSSLVGIAFGKDVTVNDLRDQVERDVVFMSLMFNADINNSQLWDYAQNQAFTSICQLKAARHRGLAVSDSQVAEFIEKLPRFKDAKGNFDMAKYDQYVKKDLRRRGLTQKELDIAVREGLLKRQLSQQVMDGVIVTPGEVREYFNEISEKISVTSAEFSAAQFKSKVKISKDDIKSFFKANSDNYQLDEQYKVKVVEFSYADLMKKAAAAVSAADMKKYYDANKKEFEVKSGKKVTVTPFAKVKAKIKAKLVLEEAKVLTRNIAQRFAVDVYKQISDDEANSVKHFLTLAQKNSKKVQDWGWVKKDTVKVKDRAVEPELLAEIAKIYINIPVSNAIAGKKSAYVVLLEKKLEARPAALTDVKFQVVKDLQKQKAIVLAREYAKKAKLAVAKAANKPAALKKLAKICKISSPDAFVMMSPPYGPHGRLIARLAENTRTGALSKVENTTDGALFVLVRKRTLPSAKEFDKSKQFVSFLYKRRKQEAAQMNFSLWLQSKCKRYEQKEK